MEPEHKTHKNSAFNISDGYNLESITSDVKAIQLALQSNADQDLEIVSKKEWHFVADQYAFLGFLINKKIVLFWVKGNVRKKHSKAVYERMKKVIAFADQSQQLYHILDLAHISSFSLSARKVYEDVLAKRYRLLQLPNIDLLQA